MVISSIILSAGPVGCVDDSLIRIPGNERREKVTDTGDCTTLDTSLSGQTDLFRRHCTSRFDNGFVQSVNGLDEGPYYTRVHTCDVGDEDIFYTIELCCSGMFS